MVRSDVLINMFSLDEKFAAITGATRGIGKSMALALAEAGADVALLQRNTEQLEIKEEIEKIGKQCAIIPCDLDDLHQVKGAVSNVVKHFGTIDILVNCAGIQRRSPAVEFSENDWDDVIQVNLKSVWLLSQEAGRVMVEKRSGKIINIASLNSYQGGINIPAYASAKGGSSNFDKGIG